MPLARLFFFLFSLSLVACTTNPYTGEQQASKAAKYGGGAAALCGILGALDSREKALRSAAACGIVGAGVGAYMDVQEAKLREQLQGTGVQVVREGNNIRLIMPGNITFQTDSYNLRGNFYPVLNSVGLVLAQYHETTMRATGGDDVASFLERHVEGDALDAARRFDDAVAAAGALKEKLKKLPAEDMLKLCACTPNSAAC